MTSGRAKVGEFVSGSSRRPIQHGTVDGYRAHYRYDEPPCDPCRAAERTRRGHKGPRKIAECGTESGYSRHLRRGEPTCPSCRAAHTTYKRGWTDTRRRRTAS